MKPHTYAIDFESYYDNNVSVAIQGPKLYGEQTDAYMVAIVGTDGLEYVGPPEDAPWDFINGAEWVSHNRTFDQSLWVCREFIGSPSRWHCSADMCAYLGIPRSLAGACEHVLDIVPDKTIRDKMKGVHFEDLDAEEKEALEEYALTDSRLCLRLWGEHKHLFPEEERLASEHTTMMANRGIPIDWGTWNQAYSALCVERDRIRDLFPWRNTEFEGKPVKLLSARAFARWCKDRDITPPTSMAKKSEEFETWKAVNEGDAIELATAFQDYRSINRTLEVVKSMDYRAKGNTCYPSLKFFGAHTGRWSGDSGLNMQNLNTREVAGVNLRHIFGCAPGEAFVICDLGQIEARVLLWMVNDSRQLTLIRDGMDVYEAHARTTMGYSDPRPMSEGDPKGRKMAKARVLGLGYGCGADRFHALATEWGLGITQHEASTTVEEFRRANPGITGLWRTLDGIYRGNIGGEWFMKLPSGRDIPYRNIRVDKETGQVKAETILGRPRGFYGGMLVENMVQATSRDILRDKILEVEKEIGNVVLHVHDEIVVKTDASMAEEVAQRVKVIMTEPKDWYSTLPLAAEVSTTRHFDK